MQHSAVQCMELPGNCVQAGDTVVVHALVCWTRACPEEIFD